MVGTLKSPIAKYGRNGDTMVAHVTKGEQIVPKPVLDKNPDLVMHIAHAIRNAGANPDQYRVGKNMSINPTTGHPEFAFGGFLHSVLKNPYVRTAAEVGASFIPGVGPLAAAGIGAGLGYVGTGNVGGALSGAAAGYGGSALNSAIGAAGAVPAAGTIGPQAGGLESGLSNLATGAPGAWGAAGGALSSSLTSPLGLASKGVQAAALASQIMGQKAPSQGGAPGITTPAPYVPKQPAAMAMPGSLSYMAGYTPDQVRSSLATQGLNGGLSNDQQSYYTNLLQRSLIGSNNQITNPNSNSFLSPIESQYFSQRGVNTSNPNQFLSGISSL